MDPLEFLARVLVHIPDKGHVTTRYYGWYANRPRGMREQAALAAAAGPPAIVPAQRLAPTEASRRWAALLQQLVEVDPLACPTCHSAMRIVAFITRASVIDQFLAHLRARLAPAAHTGARGPHRRGPARHPPHARVRCRPDDPMSSRAPHDAPRPRGDVRRARPSLGASDSAPRGSGHPTLTAARTALTAPVRDAGHTAASPRPWRGKGSRRTFDEWSTDPD